MGEKAKQIVSLDVNQLIEELNRAYADEWLAFYQYWIAAHVAQGRAARMVAQELERIAEEELEHADELAKRILQLGGRPLGNPRDWFDKANCTYKEPPADPTDIDQIIKDTIEAERCAIDVYNHLADMVRDKDDLTYDLMKHILAEEIEHEDTFENLLK